LHPLGAEQCRCKTHPVLLIHVRTLLDELRHHFEHAILRRMKEGVLAPVLAQHRLHVFPFGTIERRFAVLPEAGVSVRIAGGCSRVMHTPCRLLPLLSPLPAPAVHLSIIHPTLISMSCEPVIKTPNVPPRLPTLSLISPTGQRQVTTHLKPMI